MSRVATANYLGEADTQFQWATDDNDQFDRELDLSFLARALERHTHSAGKGLQVGTDGLANDAVTGAKIATGAVGTSELADDAVTAAKIPTGVVGTSELADGAVTSIKIGGLAVTTDRLADLSVTNAKIGTGVIHPNKLIPNSFDAVQVAAAFATGAFDAPNIADIIADNSILGDAKLGDNSVTGNSAGSAIGANVIHANRLVGGSMSEAEVDRIIPAGAIDGDRLKDGAVTPVKGGVPSGLIAAFDTLAELTAAGATWARYTSGDGRLLIGAGTTFSQTFVEATNPGGNWTPASSVGVTIGSLGASSSGIAATSEGGFLARIDGGTTEAPPKTHGHPAPSITLSGAPGITGTGTAWLPPSRVVVWGRKI
jgi:hypothetical protein